ncbi:MAG: type II secretion system protein [Nitrospirales bacterium]|nr:type II secretion system GspH family protein [Nitrospirales bacterium]
MTSVRETLTSKDCPVLQPTFSRSTGGFTLVELIGVLAILAILGSMIAPNIIHTVRAANRDAESQRLSAIGIGIELYIRQTQTFPANLAALSPDYVSLPLGQLNTNANGFLRYVYMQPNVAGYSNGTGLATNQLADARFLLISHLGQNINPSITTDADFESWWSTDETATPDLKIHRGHFGHLFRLVSLSGSGAGGSYAISGTNTNAGPGALPLYLRYHLVGTTIGLDESNTYTFPPDIQFNMTGDAGYHFDPDCPAGSKWRIISSGCYVP